MKERPILMTPENAQKCFDGVKMQTRRIIKPQPKPDPDGTKYSKTGFYWACSKVESMVNLETAKHLCPYGVVGDRLWIREAVKMCSLSHNSWISLHYKGSGDQGEAIEIPWRDDHAPLSLTKFTPSLHMPRWACRTVVEITEIRVQRIQDVTQLDALHEGCEGPDHKANFFHLWNSINGADSWDANPWVWALTFRKVPA